MSFADAIAEFRAAAAKLHETLGIEPKRARRKPSGHPIREKMAKLLTEAGYTPNGLPVSAQGYNRIYARFDDTTPCWETFCKQGVHTYHIVSYDTMTKCIRYGFDVSLDDLPLVWIYAKKPKAPAA